MPTEMNGFTFGSVVLKLLAAMNDEKQAGGNAAMASRNITHLALSGPARRGSARRNSRLRPLRRRGLPCRCFDAVDAGHDQQRQARR